jgi:hypothetical protein
MDLDIVGPELTDVCRMFGLQATDQHGSALLCPTNFVQALLRITKNKMPQYCIVCASHTDSQASVASALLMAERAWASGSRTGICKRVHTGPASSIGCGYHVYTLGQCNEPYALFDEGAVTSVTRDGRQRLQLRGMSMLCSDLLYLLGHLDHHPPSSSTVFSLTGPSNTFRTL